MTSTSTYSQSGMNEVLLYASALSTREFNHTHSDLLHVVKKGRSTRFSLSNICSLPYSDVMWADFEAMDFEAPPLVDTVLLL